MAVKRKYRLNLRNYGNLPAIMLSQYDEGYALEFEIRDGTDAASDLSAYAVTLKGTRADTLAYSFAGTVSTNVLTFVIDTTMTACDGRGTAEIAIKDTANDVLFATFNMPVFVERAAVPEGSIDADVERAQEIAEEVEELIDGATEGAEAWAVGQRGGVDVESTDETYHNNAKYYAEQAADSAASIGIDATLTQTGKAADAKKTGDEISALKEDLIATNAELTDIRVGADGTTYNSAGAAVRGQINNIDSAIYSGNVNGAFVVGSLNFNVNPWVNGSNNQQISTNADFLFHLYKGDTITLDDFTNKQIYVIQKVGDGIGYTSGWNDSIVSIPFDGEYGLIVRTTSGTFSSVDDINIIVTTQGMYDQVLKIPHVSDNSEITNDVSSVNNRRLATLDGELFVSHSLFEIVGLAIPQMVYGVSTSRISIKEGQKISLKSGDVVTLSTGVFYYGYYDGNGTVHAGSGWVNNLAVTTDGDYVFCMRYSTESTITDFDAFLDGFKIKTNGEYAKNNIARSIDLFRMNRFYDHLLLDKINGTNVIIPLQSIPHIMMSKRLGFKVIEVNVKKTLDGHYIVTHGTNGAFGAMFEHVNGTTDISSTLINSVTLEWIQTNVRFVSTYPKYRTAPATLEEFLKVVKQLKMIPLVQVEDDTTVAEIANSIMGKDNYIAYNGNRTINGGMIMRWCDLDTKAEILAKCEEYGNPFMYGMANPTDFSDSDLQDIIDAVHSNGYIIGFQDTYMSESIANKYIQMGFDFCATTWNINDIDCGNLWNVSGDINYTDFDTNGTVNSDNNLELSNGQYVRKWGASLKFLVGVVVYVRFSGTLKVNMSANFRSGTYTSDGTEYVRISAGTLNGYGEFMFTSIGNTTVYELSAKASVL